MRADKNYLRFAQHGAGRVETISLPHHQAAAGKDQPLARWSSWFPNRYEFIFTITYARDVS